MAPTTRTSNLFPARHQDIHLRIAVALGFLVTAPAAGQDTQVLRPYQRIRVTAPELGYYELTGRLLAFDSRTLRMRGVDFSYEVTIPISMLERFEVNRGKNRLYTLGVPLMGLGVGAALGPALLTEDERCRVVENEDPDCIKETPDALIGAVAGFGLVAIAARILVPERWSDVLLTEIAPTQSVLGSKGHTAARLGIRLRF